jgi:predicted Rossmann-fold nucleotide-binding protein
VLVGREYWRPLHDLLQHLAAERAIDAKDLDLLLVTDSVSEALAHIQRHAVERFGLRRRRVRPSPWLGEREARPATQRDQIPGTPIAPAA